MRLLLINPRNPLSSLTKKSRWTKYRVWKPLGLLILAGMTPRQWDVTIVDESVDIPDYEAMDRPDLVGITAFTSQVSRAFELADEFRARGVPVVMGGIHASMRPEEAAQHVDAVVKGEAESVWPGLLQDVRTGNLKPLYTGEHVDMGQVPLARNDLLTDGYAFGSIQTTRGCPLNCSFCSVSTLSGHTYRQRPVPDVIAEFRTIREKMVLIVDDNLIGISPKHIARAKELFQAIIDAKLRKKWICQVTVNMADDEELLTLAAKAGCKGVFIGFESPTAEGLAEVGKKFNMRGNRDFRASVRKIQRHRIGVVGSFIMGLDTDESGIGRKIAETASRYGVDILNALFLTPLPGTRLWDSMEAQGRIAAGTFPEDWKYFTLSCPVSQYKHLSWEHILQEMDLCGRRFYSVRRVLHRMLGTVWRRQSPVMMLLSNMSYRYNMRTDRDIWRNMDVLRGAAMNA